MSSKTISDLIEKTTALDEDVILIEDGNTTNKITKKNLLKEINSQLSHIANKGTTVEVLERVTKEEIDRQIQDGTIANLTIADGSITKEKLDPSINLDVEDNTITPNKTTFFKEECLNLAINTTWSNTGYSGTDQSIFGSNQWVCDYVKIEQNYLYTISPKMGGAPDNKFYCGKLACYDENKAYIGMTNVSQISGITGTSDNPGHRWLGEYTLLDNTKYIRICFANSHLLNGDKSTLPLTIISYAPIKETQEPNETLFKVVGNYSQKLINAILLDKSVTSEKISDIAIKEQFENNSNTKGIIKPINTDFFYISVPNLFDGELKNGAAGQNQLLTNFIDVGDSSKLFYKFKVNANSGGVSVFKYVECYDDNKVSLGKLTTSAVKIDETNLEGGTNVSRWYSDLIENTKYVIIAFNRLVFSSDDFIDSIYISKNQIDPSENPKTKYLSIKEPYSFNTSSNNNGSYASPLKGKQWVQIGDSLTNWGGGNGTINGTGFMDIVATKEGVYCKNQGMAGASWELTPLTGGVTSEPASDIYSAVRRVDALVSNKDIYTPDIITILMGTNRRVEGDLTNTKDDLYTMCGAMRYCILKLLENFPNSAIGILLPPQRNEGCDEQERINGKIKTIANYYSIPTLDLFHEGQLVAKYRSGFNSSNSGGFNDGLHLSDLGKATLGRKLCNWLKTL